MLNIQAIRTLSNQGQHREAISAAHKLLKSNPKHIPFLECYGFTLISAGDHAKALKVYLQLLKSQPQHVDYLFGAAICHTHMGQFKDAEDKYLALIALRPNDFKFKMNYGVLLREHGRLEDAETYLRQAHLDQPDFSEILHNLGITLERQERFDDALKVYDDTLALNPQHFRALSNQGNIYIKREDLEQAEAKFKAALAINPDYNNGINNLGLAYLYQGQLDAAKAAFLDVITRHPHDGKGYFNLSNLDNLTEDDLKDVITKLEDLVKNNRLNAFLDKGLFALAQFYQKQKNTKKIEEYYLKGNQLVSRLRPYDHHKTQTEFQRWHDFSTSQSAANHDHLGQQVIFIIGMPRSGTTLLESVLASNPDIAAGDELPYLNEYFNKALKNMGPKNLVMTADDLAAAAAYFHQKTARLYGGKTWLIDKLPHNFKWAPLIAQLFPKAKILHCHRDAMDNCWSLFRANFEQGHDYCFNLKAMGQYYAHYENLMRDYENVLGDRMLSVRYEDLVMHPKDEARRIFTYLGMADFEFDETKRGQDYFSKTASSAQVQDKISTKSLKGWQRHQDLLAPALAALQKQQKRHGLPVYDAD